MSRSQSRIYQQMPTPLMKVNQLINSIFAVSQHELVDQLETCSKIVSQLLQNQLIAHISSLGAAKLLCYELVLLIAEDNAVEGCRPRLSLLETAFGNNRRIRLTASIRNTLAGMVELLQELLWKNAPKKGGIEKSPLYEGYMEFKQLFSEFDQHFDDEDEQLINNLGDRVETKKSLQLDEVSQENEALIEQLEQIVAKKQRRIKQLNEELEQNIMEQRAHEDLISQLENRNISLKQEIELLNKKLAQRDLNQLHLHQKMQILKAQALTSQKQLYKKTNSKTEKTIKSKFTLEEDEEPTTVKKQYKNLNDLQMPVQQICPDCQAKKDINVEDANNFRRLLLTQAISIQALI